MKEVTFDADAVEAIGNTVHHTVSIDRSPNCHLEEHKGVLPSCQARKVWAARGKEDLFETGDWQGSLDLLNLGGVKDLPSLHP